MPLVTWSNEDDIAFMKFQTCSKLVRAEKSAGRREEKRKEEKEEKRRKKEEKRRKKNRSNAASLVHLEISFIDRSCQVEKLGVEKYSCDPVGVMVYLMRRVELSCPLMRHPIKQTWLSLTVRKFRTCWKSMNAHLSEFVIKRGRRSMRFHPCLIGALELKQDWNAR